MSQERHPNINAIALTADIIGDIESNIRGKAQEEDFISVMNLLQEDIQRFVLTVSDKLDEAYGVQTPNSSIQKAFDVVFQRPGK